MLLFDFGDSMDDELRWYLLRRKRIEELIRTAFAVFRRSHLEPVLIKGWAAARNYPENKPRFFGDVDLAVSRTQYEKARLLTETGEARALGIDLHCELRHLDTVPWDALLSRSELVDIDGEGIRILSAEDHLRVLCVHWLTNGGEDPERLFDVVYAVQNRPRGFDWEICLGEVGANRRGWIIAAIGLAHRYLGLDIEDLSFADEARSLPRWLTQCVEHEWASGVPMRPLHTALRDPRALVQQIRKRIPPNPIQATIAFEGKFDERSRTGYRVRDIFRRLGPSIGRVLPAAVQNSRGDK